MSDVQESPPVMHVGVISDTHGLLRPGALRALEGSDLILHAGDVGRPEVLAALGELAPVVAVRGNVDQGAWADHLPETALHEVGGVWVYLLHDLGALDLSPAAAGIRVVISGHSHVPSRREQDGVLYLNPGAAGPRRFKLPVSLALLHIGRGAVQVETLDLLGPASP